MLADDPIVSLWARRSRITARLAELDDKASDAVAQPLLNELVSIDNTIAATVPVSPAGAIALLRLLREHVESDPLTDLIIGSLTAGVEMLRLA